MRTLTNLLSSLIIAAWVVAIAVLSIQNFELISLKFLTLPPLELPLGIVLAFGFGIGLAGGAAVPLLLSQSQSKKRGRSR